MDTFWSVTAACNLPDGRAVTSVVPYGITGRAGSRSHPGMCGKYKSQDEGPGLGWGLEMEVGYCNEVAIRPAAGRTTKVFPLFPLHVHYTSST